MWGAARCEGRADRVGLLVQRYGSQHLLKHTKQIIVFYFTGSHNLCLYAVQARLNYAGDAAVAQPRHSRGTTVGTDTSSSNRDM